MANALSMLTEEIAGGGVFRFVGVWQDTRIYSQSSGQIYPSLVDRVPITRSEPMGGVESRLPQLPRWFVRHNRGGRNIHLWRIRNRPMQAR